MKIAIISRPGPCFPNVISLGLVSSLSELGVESKIFYDGVPFLMRLLPLHKNPKRWSNALHFRIRNKISNYFKDRNLLRELNRYDAVIISECYPNAFWKNYFAIEEFKKLFKGKVISYTESPLDAAPLNRKKTLDDDDYDESRFDFNLFVTDVMEVKKTVGQNQVVFGVNVASTGLKPERKDEFFVVLDFPQAGFEKQRQIQLEILNKLGIKTVELNGRYPIEEIRKIYTRSTAFFLSFPETFGLPIAENFTCGTTVFTPESSWPMSWRLDKNPSPMGVGSLGDCFQVYENERQLEEKLLTLKNQHFEDELHIKVFETFVRSYPQFYKGNIEGLKEFLNRIN